MLEVWDRSWVLSSKGLDLSYSYMSAVEVDLACLCIYMCVGTILSGIL